MLKDKRFFLFDIDGTVALGENLIDGAKELLDYIESINGKYIFITNNSTMGVNDYIKKFENLKVRVDESNFITAGYASALYLEENYKYKKIFCLGTKSFVSELKERNLNVTEIFESDVQCVIVGFDNELEYRKIEDVCKILSKKSVSFLATNPDLVCPVDFGFVPDCGSICQMIENAVERKPIFIGKPNKLIVDICFKKNEFLKEETLIIGDRLYTDILCGINSGIETAAVFTGETDLDEICKSSYKPTYVFNNVKELFLEILKNKL